MPRSAVSARRRSTPAAALSGGVRRRRLLVVALVVFVGLLAAGYAVRGPAATAWIAHRWHLRLGAAEAADAPVVARSLTELGEPGIERLVASLNSERESVAAASREALWRELAAWESCPPEESAPRIAHLAAALAASLEQSNPRGRREAARLAARILRWPIHPRHGDRVAVIAACESVVRAEAARGEGGGAPAPHRAAESAIQPGRPLEAPEAGGPISRLAPLPGGALPIERLDEIRGRGEIASLPVAEPAVLPESGTVFRPLTPLSPPAPANTPGSGSAGDDSPASSQRPAHDRPVPPSIGPSEYPKTDTWQLLATLVDDGGDAPVRAELVRRGLGPAEIEIGRRMHDPDAAVRRSLAEILPRLPGIDASVWLLRLCEDDDPAVRRTAMGILATTGDRGVLDRLERIARADPDPGIRQQAERLGSSRSPRR